MKLPVHAELVPPHIDGFVLETDFRISRFSALGLREAGGSAVQARAQNSRPELELGLVTRGRAQILIGEQRVVLEPQHLVFIRPQQNRLVIDASDDFRAWDLVVRRRLLERVCTTPASLPLRRRGGRVQDVLHRRIALGEARALSELFGSLPVGAGRDVFNAGLGFALARAWLAFTRAGVEQQGPAQPVVHPAVRAAAWELCAGRAELSNSALAARVGLSAHRLSRLFKRQMGTSLVEFRNRQRIERCLALLAASQRPNLLELALDVGFGSYTQFHRVFRAHVGCSPADYLRRRHATRATD
jgi:AraC-like DNA-binding protein